MTDTTPPDARTLTVLRVSNRGRDHASYVAVARRAEALGYDALVIADDGMDGLDPIAVAAGLAPVTSTIGLVPEVNTARQHPFGLARRLLGLDQVSLGRAGWAPYDVDPRRLAESVEIATRLWDSWPDDVVVADKERAVWVETERIRPVHLDGEHYSVHAPLDFHRGPQGHPLLVVRDESADLTRFSPGLALGDLVVVDLVDEVPEPPRGGRRIGATLRDRAGLGRVVAA